MAATSSRHPNLELQHNNMNQNQPPVSTPPIQPPPSPRSRSKTMLSIALQKAQSAVLFDSANNVSAALSAYRQTVRLLTQVIDRAADEADRQRLRHIVSYSQFTVML